MRKRIFRSTLLTALAVLLAGVLAVMSDLWRYFEEVQEQQLQEILDLATDGVEAAGLTFLERLDGTEFHLTWVAEDGSVLFDSGDEGGSMENRQELRDAFACGAGEGSRYSADMTEKTLYGARRAADSTVLRISVKRATAVRLLIEMLFPISLAVLLAVVLSAILSGEETKTITEPLNQLNLEQPLAHDAYEELRPLMERIAKQHRQVSEVLRELKRQKENFTQITACMKEGLVLLNEEGIVVSINPAAQQILGTDRRAVGSSFCQLERSAEVRNAMDRGFQTGHGEARLHRNETEYQYDFSRIASEERPVGAVLLVFDVTEQAQLERKRREFTANASHELKTPLQAIMGSAELIENGMVRQEDLPRFLGHIRTESARLVSLINDIIHLSQMEDGPVMTMQDVDLAEIVREAADAVEAAAGLRKIRISVSAEPVTIQGVPQLLYELAYNLCDNAVKYNRDGGAVRVSLSEEADEVLLRVTDTGIGIPHEHLNRIFERFYRVDKSHSRESGGTGLGLSIVKHAAAYHHAKIEIQSEAGRGTAITVRFYPQRNTPPNSTVCGL